MYLTEIASSHPRWWSSSLRRRTRGGWAPWRCWRSRSPRSWRTWTPTPWRNWQREKRWWQKRGYTEGRTWGWGWGAQKGPIKASTGTYVGKGTVRVRIQVQSSVLLKKLRTSQISLGLQGFRRLGSCRTGRNEPSLKHQTSGSEKIMIATSFFEWTVPLVSFVKGGGGSCSGGLLPGGGTAQVMRLDSLDAPLLLFLLSNPALSALIGRRHGDQDPSCLINEKGSKFTCRSFIGFLVHLTGRRCQIELGLNGISCFWWRI